MKSYNVYSNGQNRVIATARYAGKTVRGIAKCSPNDEFDFDTGVRLAVARCEEKIARKRKANAERKLHEAKEAARLAENYVNLMEQYLEDSEKELSLAEEVVNGFNETL